MFSMKRNNWFNNATFYEIYPQTFLDTNGDGVGDLNGIIEKLDYLKDMGFNAIWLNPIFDSPFYDAGYDVRDFYKVAPRYGTNEDLYRLFKEAHKRDMHVILDLVPGHTSIDSEWFKQSCKEERNEYSDRFIWTNSIWETPKDVACVRGFYERNGSVATNFFSIQPALNYGYLETKDDFEMKIDDPRILPNIKAMQDVIRFYLERGCDGFRVDMAGWLAKRDNQEFEGTIYIWNKILEPIKKDFPDSFFVSEWSSPKHSLSTYFDSDFLLQDWFKPLHIYMCRGENPYFKLGVNKSPKTYFDFYLDLIDFASQRDKFVSIVSGNHDTIRIKETLTDEELKLFFCFQLTMPGIPFVYYGDELGMNYRHKIKSVEGGYQRTGSRTPMQWNKTKNSGFSSSDRVYIEVNNDYEKINVENELKEKNSVLNIVKDLLHLRATHVALDNDANTQLLNKDGQNHPLVYLRFKNEERIMVAINPTDKEAALQIDDQYEVLYQYKNNNFNLTLAPQSFVVLKLL